MARKAANPLEPNSAPTWQQPVGVWRRRGATSLHIRMALGLPLDQRSSDHWETIDQEGRTIWHYWAASPRPVLGDFLSSLPHNLKDHEDNRGEHALHRLALHGHGRALEEWSEAFNGCFIPATMKDGTTLFHAAAWSGDAPTLQWACKNASEAEINGQDAEGLTPLAIAIHRFDPSELKCLLLAGADPNAVDTQGRTCLHHAAQHGLVELIAFMEDLGGDSQITDGNGTSVKSALRESVRRGMEQNQLLRENWLRRASMHSRF